MKSELLIGNAEISLVNYSKHDDADMYNCWLDIDTQKGYNYVFLDSFDEFVNYDRGLFKFWATIIDVKTDKRVGVLRLGPQETAPDLAIWIYPQYRRQGFAYKAYKLALEYIFMTFSYDEISSGVYIDNVASIKLMEKIGFKRVPNLDSVENKIFTNEETIQRVYRIKKTDFLS